MSDSAVRIPKFVPPQLAVLSQEPPSSLGWLHEIKHDGFRTLRAFTRSGLDWSDKYQRVIESCRKLRCRSALIDGGIIVQDKNGVSDFCGLP